jgi:replication initiator protein RepSA
MTMNSPPVTLPRSRREIEDTHGRILRRSTSPDHGRWLAHVAVTRGCVRPVRLTGALHTVEQATGRIVATRHTSTDLPDGVIYVPCGDRRASVCPPCAETYRADTYQLIKAGLVGGKGVPETVAGHPVVFATLTAPSFGPVHSRMVNPATGKVRPCRMRRDITRCPHGRQLICTKRHTADDPRIGGPICLDCYDHAGHVVWNGWAGELWRRTIISLTRALGRLERAHDIRLRVSYGKVAEYQRRGVVHFHALIRLDALDPPIRMPYCPHRLGSPPRTWSSSSPTPSRGPASAPPTTPTPATPGSWNGAANLTSGRSPSPPTMRRRTCRRRRWPPTWPSTPPRPPNRSGCRSPGG